MPEIQPITLEIGNIMGKVFPLLYSSIPNNIKGSIKNKDVRIIILKEIESERERKRERERGLL